MTSAAKAIRAGRLAALALLLAACGGGGDAGGGGGGAAKGNAGPPHALRGFLY